MKKVSLLLIISLLQPLYGSPDYSKIMDTFVGKNKDYPIKQFMPHVRLIEISRENKQEPYRFFGIHERDQNKADFQKFKQQLCLLMKIPTQNALQIVGDSGKFSPEGTKKGRKFLREKIDQANLVEYGFTGYKDSTGKQLDINSFVNEYVDQKPEIADKVLANIVGHTAVALEKWGTYGSPNIYNFILVYNDYASNQEPLYKDGKKVSGFTTFGNDITISDNLLQAKDGDKFICLEGGVQSFLQVLNALSLSIPVTLIYNLRTPEKEQFFSATRYLKQVADAYNKNKQLSSKEVQDIFDTYQKTLQAIWDPSKGDYKTKKELFDTAMDHFSKEQLYKKVTTLCTFIDSKALPE